MVQKVELPPSGRNAGRVDWVEAARLMTSAPGEWHLIGEFSPGVATHLRQGAYKQFLIGKPDDVSAATWMRRTWEVAARVTHRGSPRVNLYMRRMP